MASESPVSKMSIISAAGKLGISSSNNGLESFKKRAILVSLQYVIQFNYPSVILSRIRLILTPGAWTCSPPAAPSATPAC